MFVGNCNVLLLYHRNSFFLLQYFIEYRKIYILFTLKLALTSRTSFNISFCFRGPHPSLKPSHTLNKPNLQAQRKCSLLVHCFFLSPCPSTSPSTCSLVHLSIDMSGSHAICVQSSQSLWPYFQNVSWCRRPTAPEGSVATGCWHHLVETVVALPLRPMVSVNVLMYYSQAQF